MSSVLWTLHQFPNIGHYFHFLNFFIFVNSLGYFCETKILQNYWPQGCVLFRGPLIHTTKLNLRKTTSYIFTLVYEGSPLFSF